MGMNICGDNRFEIIEHYKKQLVESTNIKSSPDEMAVIDNILFRFWQMGWLREQESDEKRILKIVWDILHSGVSTDTEADQDWVYEQIRNQVHQVY